MDGSWFEPLAAGAVFEADFESLLLARAPDLYPAFHMVRFKRRVESAHGGGVPDLALIDRGYRSWWVVEVELGSHSQAHVQGQVEVFSAAKYGVADAHHLAEQDASLDESRLAEMMKGAPPRVLVLVNEAKPDWATWLRRHDALVGVVEMFRARDNRVILRVNGQHPRPVLDLVSRCTLDQWIPKALVVESPAGFPNGTGEYVDLQFEGTTSRWKRMASGEKVWLLPDRRFPLPTRQREYEIVADTDGRLTLQVPAQSSRARPQ